MFAIKSLTLYENHFYSRYESTKLWWKTLKQYWLNLFKTGLSHVEQNIELKALDIKLPFYGDLLTKHQLNNSLDLNTVLPKSLSHLHFPFHLWYNTSIVQEHSPCAPPHPASSQSNLSRLPCVYLSLQHSAKIMHLKN